MYYTLKQNLFWMRNYTCMYLIYCSKAKYVGGSKTSETTRISLWIYNRIIWNLGTVHLIFRGGDLGFWSGLRYFFQTKSKQDYFFRRPFWPDYYFFITKSYIYNIYAFATTKCTLCIIQAFATTSCFRNYLILKFKAFASYLHSMKVL